MEIRILVIGNPITPSLFRGGYFFMAKKKETKTIIDRDPLGEKLSQQFQVDWDYHKETRLGFEEKEKMILSKIDDSISLNTTKSQVMDPKLVTGIMERSFRTMAQLASGKVRALTKKNVGKSLFMDSILHNYIIPNANTQYDLLTKFRMVDFYSLAYGTFGGIVDYMIRDDYIGPDLQLVPIRWIVPQAGRFSKNDCDYISVITIVTKKWLKARNKDTWKNIDLLLEKSKGKTYDRSQLEQDAKTYNDSLSNQPTSQNNEDYQEVKLVTRYERDRWVTLAPDYDVVIRDIPNPHKNDKIPVVLKHAFPLVDRFFGLGEIERGQTLQYALNSLINLYLDGVKMSIFPPVKIDLTKVVPSTIKDEPAARWVVKSMQDAIETHNVSPQGMNTFQSTYQFLNAAILNIMGTTDTAVSAETDAGFGKTPRALAMLNARQNSRDAFDRFLMEKFVEETYDLFIDLTATKQEKPIELTLFDKEIESIARYQPDLVEMFESGDGGKLVIDPKDIKDTKYKFSIDAGSTYKKDEVLENQSISELMGMVMKIPGAPEQIAQTGVVRMGERVFDFSESLKKWVITSGIQDWDKIIKENEAAQESGAFSVENMLATDPQLSQIAQQIEAGFGGGQQQVPQQGQMPPTGQTMPMSANSNPMAPMPQ